MNELEQQQFLAKLEDMRTFIARRFDEVSMEVNATSQLLGMAEDGISTRFSEVLNVLGAVSFNGDGGTPHNMGVELDTVIKTTEEAANTILDSADAVGQILNDKSNWDDETARNEKLNDIREYMQQIVMACSFQDLTSQRIGKTLENIRKAEADLTDTMNKLGIAIEKQDVKNTSDVSTAKGSSQDDIDALFG